MKNRTILGLLTAMFVMASCGNKDKKAVADNSPAIEVKVNTVKEESSNPLLSISGKVEAVHSSNLSTRIMGYVDKVHVHVGEKVQKGQLLLRINNSDIDAKLAQANAGITEANAAFSIAEKDFIRYSNLFEENSASQKELDDITANYNMAKARLEVAKQMKNEVNAQLSYANIRAPFNGVVTNKFIKQGDMANPGMPLLEVEAPGNFQVLAMVPESEILRIKINAKATVVLKSMDKTVKGKVTEVSSSSKNTGGQYLVKVVLEKDDTEILSGMFATVQFPVEEKSASSTIFIPKEALVTKGQLSGIYTVSQSNTALLRWLRLGQTYKDSVEVLSGLSTNEKYIVDAQGKLYNGAKISIQ
ncbi:efflux RND transporter periplasmic adaptor subunit [Flagellimonas aquimarina]|uniref:Efflux RND transporter periplasmic adaptor subunit n=1 Tax=Flagellimonas aquimarina TaxID=2201895 RepID=A0A316KXT5_9FLAO|nr:efflux RND transporter periplasmic adaptor subunit [Allomuricauda koreensis]PWL37625.1 efflux RND transporter periplasmic adaptor subunit [Allomuricauda koreensis]